MARKEQYSDNYTVNRMWLATLVDQWLDEATQELRDAMLVRPRHGRSGCAGAARVTAALAKETCAEALWDLVMLYQTEIAKKEGA